MADPRDRDSREGWLQRALARLFRSCGIREGGSDPDPRGAESRLHEVIVTFRTPAGERLVIGHLYREGDGYVFEYDEHVGDRDQVQPLPDFPEFRKTYRTNRLWPFFSSRLPPLNRPDVQKVIAESGVRTDDTLELLVELASGSVVSPFDLERADAREEREGVAG